jgi:hypothetical protein
MLISCILHHWDNRILTIFLFKPENFFHFLFFNNLNPRHLSTYITVNITELQKKLNLSFIFLIFCKFIQATVSNKLYLECQHKSNSYTFFLLFEICSVKFKKIMNILLNVFSVFITVLTYFTIINVDRFKRL